MFLMVTIKHFAYLHAENSLKTVYSISGFHFYFPAETFFFFLADSHYSHHLIPFVRCAMYIMVSVRKIHNHAQNPFLSVPRDTVKFGLEPDSGFMNYRL